MMKGTLNTLVCFKLVLVACAVSPVISRAVGHKQVSTRNINSAKNRKSREEIADN